MSQPARARESTGYLSTKDVDEELARLFLASALRAPVTVHDRRSGHSTYDLEIRYPDGRRGAARPKSYQPARRSRQPSWTPSAAPATPQTAD
jgi:hypothetical protein